MAGYDEDEVTEQLMDDVGETPDWDLQLCMYDKRHLEKILGSKKSMHTWRMKERVSLSCIGVVAEAAY